MARTPTKRTTKSPTNFTLKVPVMKKPVIDNQNHQRTVKDLSKPEKKRLVVD